MTIRLATGLLTAALLTGCATSTEPAAAPSPTATSTPDDVATATPLSLGPALTGDDVTAPSLVWQVEAGLLLTSTGGLPAGHLPGWSLDRAATDRLGLPVAVDDTGTTVVLTGDGAVAVTGPLPLDGDAQVSIGETALAVFAGDEVVAELPVASPDDVWLSATGTVVGTFAGAAWDVEEATEFTLEPGCRLADRHTPDDALLVCDDGARIVGEVDVPAPSGTTWGFATVGTTGAEFVATAHGEDDVLHLGATGSPATTTIGPGAAIFYRQSGSAWVADFGDAGALRELAPDGTTTDLRAMPGVTDVAILLR